MNSDSNLPTALPEKAFGGMTMAQVKQVDAPEGLGRVTVCFKAIAAR
ncbi:MAG TPA: hypothetical protein VIM98_00435 [Dyella sp.]